MLIVAIGARAQKTYNKATWVIESAGKNAKTQTVRFYNSNAELVYQETINKRLNPSRKKVQRALNRVLDSLLAGNQAIADNSILAATFKLKR